MALLINFTTVGAQAATLDRHAKAAISMCAILCSAGVFSGILKGTGMLAAMANVSIAHIPAGLGPHIPVVLGLIAMPLSLLFDPDSFYFGILPVLASAAQGFGIPPRNLKISIGLDDGFLARDPAHWREPNWRATFSRSACRAAAPATFAWT